MVQCTAKSIIKNILHKISLKKVEITSGSEVPPDFQFDQTFTNWLGLKVLKTTLVRPYQDIL